MIKRLAAGLLLTLGLSVTALVFLVGPASAQTTSPTTSPYGSQSGSSTTDPCLVGNGTTGTTNGNCLPTSPTTGATTATTGVTTVTASNTATALQAPVTTASSGLAFTGTDVIGSVIVAFALIGGGIVVLRLSRKRPSA